MILNSVIAAYAVVGSFPGAGQDAVTIKFSPMKGQTFVYAMKGSVDIRSITRKVDATRIQTILSVESDGTYKSKWEEQGVLVDGESLPDQPEETTVSKPSGEMVSIDNSEMGQMASLDRLYYPSAPVKVGDTWSYAGKADAKLGSVDFKADMKLLGDEKIGTRDTWKIQEDLKESSGGTPAVVHHTIWVDKKDGSVVKIESDFTNTFLTANIPFPVSGKLSFMRQ